LGGFQNAAVQSDERQERRREVIDPDPSGNFASTFLFFFSAYLIERAGVAFDLREWQFCASSGRIRISEEAALEVSPTPVPDLRMFIGFDRAERLRRRRVESH
jgi:hypothetical protein